MKIENQVCNLQQAKHLLGLGVECNSFFMWHIGGVTGEWIIIDTEHSNITNEDFPAFTVAELGVLIGNKYTLSETTNHEEDSRRFICGDVFGTEDGDDYDYNICCFGATEAEARANTLIHLLENKIIDVEACNKRLVA